ncbi:hypothetical protein ACQ4PT_023672 [Festuca glaucescens]
MNGDGFPTDVLVYILERFQPNAGRRLRLVCQHWRQVIDTCTRLGSRWKTLVVTTEKAYIFDDLSTGRWSWEVPMWHGRWWGTRNDVVGTCNGIICMCNEFGGIVLHNPVTGERLAVPSLPRRHLNGPRIWHRTYRFTHDQATGRYMVMHVPNLKDWVVVFTP